MLRWASLLICVAVLPAAFGQSGWGTRADGTPVTRLDSLGSKVVVLFFVASDCPISNRTFPEMQRLREEFASRGVTFWYVYPNQGETAADVAAHQASFDPRGVALLAPGPELVRLTHAVATPEVSLLRLDGKANWIAAYTGKIDNRYVRFGQERTQVTAHYAEDAIQAVLAGRTPATPVGSPVGCAIINPGVSRR